MITAGWIWDFIAFLLVLAIWSVAWGDNAVYRLAEHTLIGATTGYVAFIGLDALGKMMSPIWDKGAVGLVIPLILGMFVFARWTKWPWFYRYPAAIMVGVGTGLALRTLLEAQFTAQIAATVLPIATSNLLTNFNNLVIIVATVSALFYFIFTLPQKGRIVRPTGYVSELGRYVLMITFGTGFTAFLITAYVYLIERVSFVVNFLRGG